jgi:hypothetical protein
MNNPYLGLLSLLFLGTSLAIFILKISNFGQYVVALQLFISEVAFRSMILQSSMCCSVVIFLLRKNMVVIHESFLKSQMAIHSHLRFDIFKHYD